MMDRNKTMEMRKLKETFFPILITVFVCLAMASCSDDDKDTDYADLIVGTWKYTSVYGGTLLTFEKNGTFSEVELDENHNPEPGVENGTYTLNGDILTLRYDYGFMKAQIMVLTENNLVLRWIGEGNNQESWEYPDSDDIDEFTRVR